LNFDLQFNILDSGESPEADEFIRKRGYAYKEEVNLDIFFHKVFFLSKRLCEFVCFSISTALALQSTKVNAKISNHFYF
jgi:hypothetical protein